MQTLWKDELGKRWILGKGLIESSIEQNVFKSDMSLNEYKQYVRSSGLWMSFTQDLSFTDEKFKKLDSLCSSGINNPRGRQICPLALPFALNNCRWILFLLGWIPLQNARWNNSILASWMWPYPGQ